MAQEDLRKLGYGEQHRSSGQGADGDGGGSVGARTPAAAVERGRERTGFVAGLRRDT